MPLPATLPQDEEDGGGGDQATPTSPCNCRPKKKCRVSEDGSPLATTAKKATKASNKRKASTMDKENTPPPMTCEETVEALTIAKMNIINKTLVQRAALIDAKKTQAEARLAKETTRQLEIELELARAKAESESPSWSWRGRGQTPTSISNSLNSKNYD